MLTRRELLESGLMAGGAGGTTQPAGVDPRRVEEIAEHLQAIAAELRVANAGCSTGSCPAAARIREAMVVFLRANAKFPDALEVGPGVFFDIYDWHVRNRQTLNVGRGPDGRYGLGFMFTRLLLRPDAQPDYTGVPYDVRP